MKLGKLGLVGAALLSSLATGMMLELLPPSALLEVRRVDNQNNFSKKESSLEYPFKIEKYILHTPEYVLHLRKDLPTKQGIDPIYRFDFYARVRALFLLRYISLIRVEIFVLKRLMFRRDMENNLER